MLRSSLKAGSIWIKGKRAAKQSCNLDIINTVQGICKSAVSPDSFYIVDRFVFAGGSRETQFSLLLIFAPSVLYRQLPLLPLAVHTDS